MRKDTYKTSQKEMIIEFFKKNHNQHLTIKEVEYFLNQNQQKVGLTTIYRCVDKLVKEGILKKYIVDNNSSACFEYCNQKCDHKTHIHLKCESCNSLIHLDCDEIAELETHILKNHHFKINPLKTVYYGTCAKCK